MMQHNNSLFHNVFDILRYGLGSFLSSDEPDDQEYVLD